MHTISLDSETDFDGWRQAARRLALNEVKPQDVTWTVRNAEPELFASETDDLPEATEGTFNVPAKFVELARIAILHRNPERFALLYRLLWRLRSHHDLLNAATDPDVAEINAMARAVHRDEHKMHAFVRFREVGREQKAHYVAWFEPEHHIVALAAPFFAKRFADMPWSILTPDLCAHWDGHEIAITPGVAKSEAPGEDRLEETWRSYYAAIFNPARLKVKAMQTEMPQKYWRNLPEASLIKPLIESAERTTSAMIANVASDPHKPQKRQDAPMPRNRTHDTIAVLREEAAGYVSQHQINEGTYPSLAVLVRDIGQQVAQYGSLAKFPADVVGNTRNDMYLASEAIRFLMKDKEAELSATDVATLNEYKGSLDAATKFIPSWVKFAVAIALGLGTMVGWKRIVVTVGEKIGKTHLTYAQGACAEITAAATIAAADGYGLPVSTTHVLSSGIAGTMAANGSGLQWATIRNIAMAWVLTLPAAMILSGVLYFVFYHVF